MNSIEKIKKRKQKNFKPLEKIKSWEEQNLDTSLWSPILKINFKSFWTWFIILLFLIIVCLGILAKYLG